MRDPGGGVGDRLWGERVRPIRLQRHADEVRIGYEPRGLARTLLGYRGLQHLEEFDIVVVVSHRCLLSWCGALRCACGSVIDAAARRPARRGTPRRPPPCPRGLSCR